MIAAWRRRLHDMPETAFTEHATGRFAAGVLRDLGFAVTTGIGRTGVVASLTRGRSGRAVGLRAETAPSIEAALVGLGDRAWERPPRVLICGSLYLAADVLTANGTPPA